MSLSGSNAHGDTEPMPGRGGIEGFIGIKGDESKHPDAISNFDSGGASAQRGRGSIDSGFFGGCTTERSIAETSSSSVKIFTFP